MTGETRQFIIDNTDFAVPPHVPEVRLRLATEAHELWLKTEDELEGMGLPPPYWAFAWAGGQGLARYVLDHPDEIRGRSVFDFATGSGLVAIAARHAGAGSVTACDIDAFAAMAAALNADANNVRFALRCDDLIGGDDGWQVVLAGDVFYDQDLGKRLVPWFDRLARRGALILIGDPGRSYCPREKLTEIATYQVPVTRALEDSEVKKATVWRFEKPAEGLDEQPPISR